MAIDRGPWNALVDDDGSNLVGTVWNKDKIKTVILDPVDAAILPTYGTFTPNDASGAGLALTLAVGTFYQHGRYISTWMHVTDPVTSNGLGAKVGGLPGIVAGPGAGGVHGYGVFNFWYVPDGTNYMIPIEPLTGTFRTNADMSGANVIVSVAYLPP
jgi:hypothetical protein